jgi:hypothetical protein
MQYLPSLKSSAFGYLENLNNLCNSVNNNLIPTIETISSVAFVILGAFSAYTSPKLFTAFFIAGSVIGVCAYFNEKMQKAKPHKHNHESSGCVDGFFSEISKIKLPATVLVVANFVITWVHMDHHIEAYGPFAALYCGAVFGRHVTAYLDPSPSRKTA